MAQVLELIRSTQRLFAFTVLTAMLIVCCARSETRDVGGHSGAGRDASGSTAPAARPGVTFVPMSERVVRDRIRGAWLGQMIGISWGFPTEFYARYIWQLFPEIHQFNGVPQNIYTVYDVVIP
jgi:hypothetical protein